MPGSTFQPPINLDPNQDNSQQISFINQNFQSIASTLETNSFRVVGGPLTMQVGDAVGASQNWTTVPHGLDFTPIVIGFVNNATISTVSTNASLQLPTWGSVSVDLVNNFIKFKTWLQIFADSTNVYGYLINSTGAPVSNFTITYYYLQLPSQS